MKTIAEAYIAACFAELDALKPGNVHRHAEGHGMTVADFETSARVSAPPLTAPGVRVGARVLGAVQATRAAVGQNTNLGIVLLCAPLAAAAERDLDLRATLDGLDAADARDVYAAIALANPGGLGDVPEHDVRTPPTIPLLAAMAEASNRDLVARQFANGFADIFDVGLPAFAGPDPVVSVYLAFLAAAPDSHIARKFGREIAEDVRRDAAARAPRLAALDAPSRRAELLRWDSELKARGLNPGATADLTVATVFAAYLTSMREERLAGRRQE